MADKAMPKWEGFKHLSKSLARNGVKDPKALAAWIGRKKFGSKKFNKASATGTSLRHAMPKYQGKK